LFSVCAKSRSELAMIMLHEVRAKEACAPVRKSCGCISIHRKENAGLSLEYLNRVSVPALLVEEKLCKSSS